VTILREEVCTLLEEFGLPAVRVNPASAEVIEFNGLFPSLINVAAPLDYRLWFVEGVLPRMTLADRARWEGALADRTPVRVPVAFKSVDGRVLDFEMRSAPSVGQKKFGQSILCLFIPYTNPFFERVCAAQLSEGRELERCRIQNELHKGVSQQLLGAAFGCKLLAGKVVTLSEDLGKEASDLAELLNEAVLELQNLVQSSENQG
jgi:Histidine kinase